MAYTATVKLEGDTKTYALSKTIKKYTLMDLGFVKGRSGVFSLERSLDPMSPYQAAYKLKMTVDADLTGYKMAVVTGNGAQRANIFKNDVHPEAVEQLRFVMANFIERDVLTEV